MHPSLAMLQKWREHLRDPCTVYIAFLAALYDSLLFDRPLSFFLSGNMSYAVANLTWRVFQGAAKLPSVPEPNNLTERSLGAATLSSFLKRAEDTGLLNGNFDHVVGVRERLLAANVNAFGGKTLGENTWTYRFVATWWTPMGISGFVSFLDEIFEAMNSSQEVRQKVTKQVSTMGCLLNQQQAVRASDCLAEAMDVFTEDTAAAAKALMHQVQAVTRITSSIDSSKR